jgi:peptidoglycan/xylan/chitin deacetylase (PgdA/CDA1 family)
VKRQVRVAVERLAAAIGWTAGAERSMHGALTILTFHRVLPDARAASYAFPSLAVPQSVFSSLIDSLAQHHDLVTVAEGLRRLADPAGAGARPVVALSFDDGYADNLLLAAPVLERAGVRGTFYVVAGLVGTEGEFWYDVAARRHAAVPGHHLLALLQPVLGSAVSRLDQRAGLPGWMQWLKSLSPPEREAAIAALPDPGRAGEHAELDRVMTPDQLRRLAAAGHEVGSHTLTHPLLPQLDDAQLAHELAASREMLQGWLQSPVSGFCYPNGDHDDRVVDAVRRAGYGHACTTQHGRNAPAADPYRLRRVDMHPGRLTAANGRFDASSARATVSMALRRA